MTRTGKRLRKPMNGQWTRRTAGSHANRALTLADSEMITLDVAREYGLPSYLNAPAPQRALSRAVSFSSTA